MKGNMQWFPWAMGSAAFAALTTLLAKKGLEGVDPDLATLWRTVIILVMLAGWVMAAGKWTNPMALPARPMVYLILSGLATGASWLCYYRGLHLGPAAKVATVDKFSLVLVALLGQWLLLERLNLREWTGVALMAGGVLVLAMKR